MQNVKIKSSLEIAKTICKYYPSIKMSGSVLLLELGVEYKDIQDIDLFCSTPEAIYFIETFLRDHDYTTGGCVDKYGDIRSSTCFGGDKPIHINFVRKKDEILTTISQVINFKFKRGFGDPVNNQKDFDHIITVCKHLRDDSIKERT